MQLRAENQNLVSALSNYQQILYQFFDFTQNLKQSLKITPGSVCSLNVLAIDEPLEYAKLYLDGTMQIWVDAEDTLYL